MNKHTNVRLAFSLLSFLCLPTCRNSQTNRSSSDADINAIGQRHLGQGMNFCSLEKEKALGDTLAAEVKRFSIFLEDAPTAAYLEGVAHQVEQNSDQHVPIAIHVLDTQLVKGFILPAGHVHMSRGLLMQLQSEGELASLLARGVAHTALRFSTRMFTKNELLQICVPAAASFGSVSDIPPGIYMYERFALGTPLVQLKFLRDAESEADYFALQYVYKSGYDPQCFLDFVRRIWSQRKPVPKPFDTYLPLPERLQDLKKEMAQILPPRDDAIVTTSAFEEFKDHLQSLPPAPPPKQPELRRRSTQPRP